MADAAGERKSYITQEGVDKLRAELEQLWKIERPKVTQEVADAAAQADRSENAEYIYGKKRLREIDRRLRFLAKRMDDLTIVRTTPDQQARIFFGAWVSLEEEDGSQRELRLVGPDESEPGAGLVSIESPIGLALMGKEAGDEVTLRRPRGDIQLRVIGIRYEVEPPS